MYTTSPFVLVEYRQTTSKLQHKRYYKKLKKAFGDIKKQISFDGDNLKLTRKNPLAVELIIALDQFLRHGILSSDLSYWKFLCEYLTKREILDIKFDFGKDDNHLNCIGWLKSSLTSKFLQHHLRCFFNGDRKLNVKYYSDKAAFFNKEIQDYILTELSIIDVKTDFILIPQSDEMHTNLNEIRPAVDVIDNFILPNRSNDDSLSTSSEDSIIECNYLIKDTEPDKSSSLNNYLIDDNEGSKTKEFKLKKMQEDVTEGDLSKILSNCKVEEVEGQENAIEKHLEMMRAANPYNSTDKPIQGSPIEILTNDEQLERERMVQIEKEVKLLGSNRIRTISKTVDELKSESVPSNNFTENCISKLKNRKNSTDDKKEKVLEKYENTFKTVKLTRNRTNPESFLINSIRNFGQTDMFGKSPTTSLAELFHEPTSRITTTGTNLFDLPADSDMSNDDGQSTPIVKENINNESKYGEIPQDPGDIMHLLAEVFLDGKEKFDSMFGVFIDHSIEEPKFRYLCISNMNIYLLSKVTEGIAFACEAISEEPKIIDNELNDRDEDDESSYTPTKNLERKHESASYVTHLIIPLNDIDMISISYDYQSIICSSKNGCFIMDNCIVKKNNFSYCIDIGSQLLGQNIFKKIKITCEKSINDSSDKNINMPIISIDQNIKRFFHIKFLKDELKKDDVTVECFSLIYWKHENISSLNEGGSSTTGAKLLYREEDTTSWKIVSSKPYKPWREAYCELTYNQIIGFRDPEGKDAIFSMVICEHVENIVEEYDDPSDLHIFTVIPKDNYNKTRFQLGFLNYNDMCKWMNIMKEFLENSEFKEFNRPISTLFFATKNHILIASEHINFNEKGSMRVYFSKKIDTNTKIMYHDTDNRHVIIIFDNTNGYHCLLFRDDFELERVVSAISSIFGITILPLLELKESDKGSYFRLVQSFDEWINVWPEHFTNECLTN